MEELKEKREKDMDLSIEESITGDLQAVEENLPVPEHNEGAVSLLERIQARQHIIGHIKEDHSHRIAMLEEKLELAKATRDKEIEVVRKSIAWLTFPLEQFMRAINASNPKIKSLKLPTGILKLRKSENLIICEGWILSKDTPRRCGVGD